MQRRTTADGPHRILRAAALAVLLAAGSPGYALDGQSLASPDLMKMVRWVLGSGDNGGAPFVIVDKKQARLQVYEPDGRLVGSAPVLLGLAQGDRVVPGSEDRPLSQIKRDERVTPAGRFVARPGHNHLGEDVIWVDFDAGISMHRMRAVHPAERRMERLSSSTPLDNRISYGCINVAVAFYDAVLKPAAKRAAVIYVLPENQPAAQWFGFPPGR